MDEGLGFAVAIPSGSGVLLGSTEVLSGARREGGGHEQRGLLARWRAARMRGEGWGLRGREEGKDTDTHMLGLPLISRRSLHLQHPQHVWHAPDEQHSHTTL
jgi:hypothetical protein